jgi:transposase
LAEYGIAIPKGFSTLRKRLPQILEDAENELTADTRELFFELQEEFRALDKRILIYDHKLKQLFKTNENCQRIANIEGIGPIVATAIISRLGNPKQFKNGRHFSAFLGLVPRHVSSGGKTQLLGISKRGDVYLRTLLIHGARSALIMASKKTDSRSVWLQGIEARRGINRASVALANKNARIIWSLIAHQQEYHPVV